MKLYVQDLRTILKLCVCICEGMVSPNVPSPHFAPAFPHFPLISCVSTFKRVCAYITIYIRYIGYNVESMYLSVVHYSVV